MQKPEYLDLPIEKLLRGRYQPRREFDGEALEELAISIKSNGLIQPIVVRPLAKDRYEIIAGERRWRAAQMAGIHAIPCLINYYSDTQAAAVTTIENINRVNLNPIEEATAYQRLIDEFNYIHEEIAAIVGKSRVKITNILRLLKLEKTVQQLLISEQISEGHGKALVSLPPAQQATLAQTCVDQGWSVRKLEQHIKKASLPQKALQHTQDTNIQALETHVSEQFGAEVKLEADQSQSSGWLKIRYFDYDTLSGLLDKMGVRYEDE